MRFKEFVTESSTKLDSKLKAAIQQELNNQINSFRKTLLPLGFFQIYDIFNTVASADGVNPVPAKHPYHNHTSAAPYTPIERKMLQAAYTAMDQPWDDSILDLTDNPDSQQADGEGSPVIPFGGYPR